MIITLLSFDDALVASAELNSISLETFNRMLATGEKSPTLIALRNAYGCLVSDVWPCIGDRCFADAGSHIVRTALRLIDYLGNGNQWSDDKVVPIINTAQ
jgi:hypothetical protein